uniref:Uncharacterized protein n=1 Tax=Mycena chlorophos TaxID=658473 RepID=A0ABQ0M0W4_MYCCL|nr:predicted protein [Mycena chlorophos]
MCQHVYLNALGPGPYGEPVPTGDVQKVSDCGQQTCPWSLAHPLSLYRHGYSNASLAGSYAGGHNITAGAAAGTGAFNAPPPLPPSLILPPNVPGPAIPNMQTQQNGQNPTGQIEPGECPNCGAGPNGGAGVPLATSSFALRVGSTRIGITRSGRPGWKKGAREGVQCGKMEVLRRERIWA